MQIGGAKWAKSSYPAHELNRLQFATEAEFEDAPNGESVGRGEPERLQISIAQVRPGRQAGFGT